MPVREIADLLGVPEGTAKARLARGRATLAALLDDPLEAPSGRPRLARPSR